MFFFLKDGHKNSVRLLNNKQKGWNRITENTWGVFSLLFVPYFSYLTRIFVAIARVLKGGGFWSFSIYLCVCVFILFCVLYALGIDLFTVNVLQT